MTWKGPTIPQLFPLHMAFVFPKFLQDGQRSETMETSILSKGLVEQEQKTIFISTSPHPYYVSSSSCLFNPNIVLSTCIGHIQIVPWLRPPGIWLLKDILY